MATTRCNKLPFAFTGLQVVKLLSVPKSSYTCACMHRQNRTRFPISSENATHQSSINRLSVPSVLMHRKAACESSNPHINCNLLSKSSGLIFTQSRGLCTANDWEEAEMEAWEMLVDYKKLSPLEKKNHERHVAACKAHKEHYTDVATGYQVMTRYAHQKRGNCCGNACRHCPYGHKSVPEEFKTKKFNSAYYV